MTWILLIVGYLVALVTVLLFIRGAARTNAEAQRGPAGENHGAMIAESPRDASPDVPTDPSGRKT